MDVEGAAGNNDAALNDGVDIEEVRLGDKFFEQEPVNEAGGGLLSNIFAFITSIQSFFESYGWFILIGGLILYYLYNKYRDRLPSLANGRGSVSQSKKNDSQHELDRLRSIEAARLRQQAAMDAAAAKYLEEQRLKEEQKAKEKAEEWEKHQQGLGYKNKTKKPSDEDELASLGLGNRNIGGKPKLRGSDYNPLTGQSGNSNNFDGPACYRPSRRGGGAGRGG